MATFAQCHVWTAPSWQELFGGDARLVGAAMWQETGVKNKRTAALERAQAKAAAKIEGVLGPQGDAHALLTAVYKDESQAIDLRVQAAKAAIAYEKPRLATVESKVGGSPSLDPEN